jgi:hypothetical protein
VFSYLKTLANHLLTLNIGMETNITITDLIALRNIINLAAERGAFKAEEMLDVGTVYTKLTKFLEAVVAQAAAQEQQTAEATQPTGE